MIFKKKKHDDHKIFVEVLQNGELLSKTSRLFHKPGIIKLTSDPSGELTAPFYPLPTDIDLVRITKRGAEVDLDPNWEGFTTYEGRVEDISSHRSTQYTHIMKKGDYGSIAYNDLRVLIRIGKERPKSKHLSKSKSKSEYKSGKLTLWIESKKAASSLFVGCLASIWLFGSFTAALVYRPDTRPKEFFDLKPVYTLPFIHPRHLELAPEALQKNLNRTDLIGNAYKYYMNLAATYFGFGKKGSKLIYNNTNKSYRAIHKKYQKNIRNLIRIKKIEEDEFSNKKYQSRVFIPSVIGETLEQSLLRLKDKMLIVHQNLTHSLEYRNEFTKKFSSDKNYYFEQYRKLNRELRPSNSENLEPSLDEITMYQEAKDLSLIASYQQSEMRKFREFSEPITATNTRPISIDQHEKLVSYLPHIDLSKLNKKLNLIRASTFDLRRSGMVAEPLVGEINPELILKLVAEHKFQLQLCFELALRRNNSISGNMEWSWRLDSKGDISDIELLDSSIDDRRMIRCIRKKIASWRFPRPKRGSIEIKYPFYFAPAKG